MTEKCIHKILSPLSPFEDIEHTMRSMIDAIKSKMAYYTQYDLEWHITQPLLNRIKFNLRNEFKRVWYCEPLRNETIIFGINAVVVNGTEPYEVTLCAKRKHYSNIEYPSYMKYFVDDVISTALTSKMYVQNQEVSQLINFNVKDSIKDVIFNEPATIVLWKDGTKTVVKCGENDTYDAEKGLAMCIVKKITGNRGNYNNIFRQWLPKEDDEDSV